MTWQVYPMCTTSLIVRLRRRNRREAEFVKAELVIYQLPSYTEPKAGLG